MPENANTSLLTAKEVADLLRLAPSTVFDAAARGDLPCVRLWRGRRKSLLRFVRSDIEALIGGAQAVGRAEGHRSTR